MSDKLYYFTLGVVIMVFISMFIIRYSPLPKTEIACNYCTECWWFAESEGGE